MISLKNIIKKYKHRIILEKINLEINPGEVIGIIGGNGSGKSTILKIISGLTYVDSGEVIILKKQLKRGFTGKTPQKMGVLIESPSFLPNYTGLRNLLLLASIQNKIDKEYIVKIMEKVGLDPNDKRVVRHYSQGMKQRLAIAQAIMEKPKILLLDEPTNGLDKNGVEMLKSVVMEQKKKSVAIVLVSHLQSDIDELCDRVYLLKEGTLHHYQTEKEWYVVVETLSDLERLSEFFPHLKIGERYQGLPTGRITGSWEDAQKLEKTLSENNISFVEVREDMLNVTV
ncbi:ATP-binding cassette domain-containing protein [Caldalkalibacillus mannanilyticus]|uniref:ATP-binding cassette domain-containing protein n=1 Tax=Caldalkalibacillus mannanilyticus TaxID=1418 RepID=UPI00046AEEC2|nr:ABC transporter ATP-binding protein [Caldalkalibacillus mannanilyticus]